MSKPTGALTVGQSLGVTIGSHDTLDTLASEVYHYAFRATPALDDPDQTAMTGQDLNLPITSDIHLRKTLATASYYWSVDFNKWHNQGTEVSAADSGDWQDANIETNDITNGYGVLSSYAPGDSGRRPLYDRMAWSVWGVDTKRLSNLFILNGTYVEQRYPTDDPDSFYYAGEGDHLFDQYHFVSAYHLSWLLASSYNRMITEAKDAQSIPICGYVEVPE